MIVYVDVVAGDDANTGLTPDQAWATLAQVNQADLAPGSQVLLKRGSTWNEPFKLRGRAPAENPILLSAYGDGPRPRINGGPTHAITADEPVSPTALTHCGTESPFRRTWNHSSAALAE